MGKLFNKIPSLIMEGMKEGEPVKANAFRNLKAKLLEWKTSKEGAPIVNANNGEIPDAQEIIILKKYIKELENDIDLYRNVNPILALSSQFEVNYFYPLMPPAASEQDIKNCVESWMKNQGVETIEQKQMGIIIKYVKNEVENADGKMVSDIVKSYINK